MINNDEPLDLSFGTLTAAAVTTNKAPNNVLNQYLQCQPTDSNNLIASLPSTLLLDIPSKLLAIEYNLSKQIEHITFDTPVEYVYNPIDYALSVHSNFLHKYCHTTKKILFLGMNPGPWGMSQTGIPFGEINTVVNWLQIVGFIGKPVKEQPARKIVGFACKRSEISGRRFWKLFKDMCITPDFFFQNSFIRNYCPVALMDSTGRNITPAELKATYCYVYLFYLIIN